MDRKPLTRGEHDVAEAIFSVHGLTKVYPSGEVEVRSLAGVDLDIWKGEMVVLLGPSGSGRSTLLNIMGGLDRATSGEVNALLLRRMELGQDELDTPLPARSGASP